MKFTLCRSEKNRQETWARWFAWRPVFAESADDAGGCILVWMQEVECKEARGYGGWGWRYREIV